MKYLPKLVKIVRRDVADQMVTNDALSNLFFPIDRSTYSTIRAITQQAVDELHPGKVR